MHATLKQQLKYLWHLKFAFFRQIWILGHILLLNLLTEWEITQNWLNLLGRCLAHDYSTDVWDRTTLWATSEASCLFNPVSSPLSVLVLLLDDLVRSILWQTHRQTDERKDHKWLFRSWLCLVSGKQKVSDVNDGWILNTADSFVAVYGCFNLPLFKYMSWKRNYYILSHNVIA